MKDKHVRSVVKGMSWRALATLTTITLVFIFTGKVVLALEVGMFEVIAKLMLYYVHERAWNKTRWGKIL